MIFPFLDFESSFFTNEELLFLAGASGGGVEHTIINNPATFTTDLAKPLLRFVIPFTSESGLTGLNIYRTGKNIYDGQFPSLSSNIYYRHYFVGYATVTGSSNVPLSAQGYGNIFLLPGKVNSGVSTGGNNITNGVSRTVNPVDGWVTVAYRNNYDVNPADYNVQIEVGATASAYEPFSGTIIPVSWQTEAGAVNEGELDALTGVLTVTSPESKTVQLDPVTLSTLVGENVIWTDTNGDNTITYLKKT